MSLIRFIKRIQNSIPALLLSGMLFFFSCSNTITGPDFGPERKIVFSAGGNLFITSPEGTRLKQLTFTSNHWAPAWSPDGEKIAFLSNQIENSVDIFTIDTDGSNMTRLTFETGSNSSTRWSPDGTKIAFISGDATGKPIYLMDADGSNQTQLTSGNTEDVDFNFSPDGNKIVYFTRYHPDNFSGQVSDIYIMNADGSNNTRIATGYINHLSEFSPDGTKIVYVNGNGPEGWNIYIMNVDGTDKTRLTFNESIDSSPSFSPDGTKIVYSSYESGLSEIYTMNVDGTNEIRLTHLGIPLFDERINNIIPKWSPDGDHIVYLEWLQIQFETVKTTLKIMRRDGSQQVSLASGPGFINFSFSPVW